MNHTETTPANLPITSPFILAPLAGYTDLPFRLLCREHGAGLVFSEMLSCHGLVFRQKNTLAMLRTVPKERPVAFQLFGAEPDIMGEAARMLSDLPIDAIDINMGCPVKKVIRKGGGAALMKDPARAAAILRSVRSNTLLPVTIKIRTGWNHETKNAIDFAKMATDEGASAITVHARTWTDGFSGKVDWETVRKVRRATTITVIGNGSITSREEGQWVMEETACDAVMIGRAALGAPWIFSDHPAPSLAARARILLRHQDLVVALLPAGNHLPRLKNHAGRYFKGIDDSSSIRRRIYAASSMEELRDTVAGLAGEGCGNNETAGCG